MTTNTGSGLTNRPLRIGVLGATGVIGRRICEVLDRIIAATGAPISLTLMGRDQARLLRASSLLSNAPCEVVADLRDPRALELALAPLSLVINAAGPYADTGVTVARAAIAAGIHYVDVASEQQHVRQVVERLDAPARRANVTIVPSAGLTCALTDWACDMLQANLARDSSQAILDEVTTTYVYDNWHMSAGSQRALFGSLGMAAARWHRDRWLPTRFGERAITCVLGAEFGGQRTAVWHPSPDIILLSRRIQALAIDAYVSPNRSNNLATVLRGAGLAMSLLPMKSLASVLGPFVPDDSDFSQGRFAVITQLRAGPIMRRMITTGQDIYQTSAILAARVALRVLSHGAPPGVQSVAQFWPAHDALATLQEPCGLHFEPGLA
ncbi:MAG: saccharopine dehydrogenase NADP-binding domain-containing protein [Kofleriaceae bacterium]|nr:saccharopine dehydrogenase NADP-binding domain-containing protein [Kofleriaceae bacterium]